MSELYEELNTIDLGSEIESLQRRNSQLENHIKCLEGDIETLCKTITDMKQTQINLSNNISALYKTAKAEIDRKDRIIAELRRELDDLKFRRNRYNNQVTNDRKRSRERISDECEIVEIKKKKIEPSLNVIQDEDIKIEESRKFDKQDYCQADFRRSKSREIKEDVMQNDVKRTRTTSEDNYQNSRSRSREYKDRIHSKSSQSRTRSPVLSSRQNFDRNRHFSSRRSRSPSPHRNYHSRLYNDPRNNRFNGFRDNRYNNYHDDQRQVFSYDRGKLDDNIDKNRDRNSEKSDKNNEKRNDTLDKDVLKPNRDKFDEKNKNEGKKMMIDKKDNNRNDKSKVEQNNKLKNSSGSDNSSKKDKTQKTDKINEEKDAKKTESKYQENSKSKSDPRQANKSKKDILKAKQVDLFGFESSDTMLISPEKDVNVENNISEKVVDLEKNAAEVLTNEDTLDLEMQYEHLQKEIKKIDENEERQKQYYISGDITKYRIPKKSSNNEEVLKSKAVEKKVRKPSISEQKPTEMNDKLIKCKDDKNRIIDKKLNKKNEPKKSTGKEEISKSGILDAKVKKSSTSEENPSETKQKCEEIKSTTNKGIESSKKSKLQLRKPERSKSTEEKIKNTKEKDAATKISNSEISKVDETKPEKCKPKKLTLQEYNSKNSNIKTENLENKKLDNTKKVETSISNNVNQLKSNSRDEVPKKIVPKTKQKSLDMISLSSPVKTNVRKRKSIDSIKSPSKSKELEKSPLKTVSSPIEIIDSPQKPLKSFKNILVDEIANDSPANNPVHPYDVTHDGEIPTLHLEDQNYLPVVTNFDSTRDRCNFMKLLDGEEKSGENKVESSQSLSDNNSPGRLTFTNCLSKITSTPKPNEIIVSAAPKVIDKTEKSPVQNGCDSIASDSSSKKENLSATPTKAFQRKRGRVVLSFRN